jgi:hypothetical protein
MRPSLLHFFLFFFIYNLLSLGGVIFVAKKIRIRASEKKLSGFRESKHIHHIPYQPEAQTRPQLSL